jgi:hypothetical protein
VPCYFRTFPVVCCATVVGLSITIKHHSTFLFDGTVEISRHNKVGPLYLEEQGTL